MNEQWNCTRPYYVGENCDVSYAQYMGLKYEIGSSIVIVADICLLFYSIFLVIIETKAKGKKYFTKDVLKNLPKLAVWGCLLVSILFLIVCIDFKSFRGILPNELGLLFFHLSSAMIILLAFYALRFYLSILKLSMIGKGTITSFQLSNAYIAMMFTISAITCLLAVLRVSLSSGLSILRVLHQFIYIIQLILLTSISAHISRILGKYIQKQKQSLLHSSSMCTSMRDPSMMPGQSSANLANENESHRETFTSIKCNDVNENNMSRDRLSIIKTEEIRAIQGQENSIIVIGESMPELPNSSIKESSTESKTTKNTIPSKTGKKKRGYEKRYKKALIMNVLISILVVLLCIANMYNVYSEITDPKDTIYSYNDPPSVFSFYLSCIPDLVVIGGSFTLLYYFSNVK